MITLSENAANEIKRIKSNKTFSEGTILRVKVVGGGCSGMSYKLDFDEKGATASDKVFEGFGVSVCVDPKSFLFLKDSMLDYSGGLNGKGFVFSNPNATRSCGCGSSFSV